MTWPTDNLTNTNLDQSTDRPDLARAELNALLLKVQAILAEAPAGSTLLTDQDAGPGNGLNADLLDGEHASAFADASHNHSASNITSGTLSAARGGTGRSSLTQHAVLCGNLTGAVGQAGPGTSGQVLTSTGLGSFPTFQDLPTYPTVDVNASDFAATTLEATGGSGVWEETWATGLSGGSNIVWGITGIRRVDGTAETINGYAKDAFGFHYPIGSNSSGDVILPAVTGLPTAGSIKIYFTYNSGGSIAFRVRLWARNNV